MSRTLKVTANHVMYDRSAWFLRVIMSSLRVLCCLPSVKKQKHDFQVCFVDRAGHPKNSWRQGHTKHKKVDEMAKELFADYVKEKNWANLRKRKSWHKLWKHTFYVEARKKEFVQCIIKQLLDSVFVISRIIKVSVRVISRSRRLRLINPTSTLTLIILDITKTSSNNCLLLWKASMRCRIKQFARESVRLCPFRGLYVREFKLSHSNRVNRIIKITHAHNLFVKMLDFSPFTIRT